MMAMMTEGNDCNDDNRVMMAMMTIGNGGNDDNKAMMAMRCVRVVSTRCDQSSPCPGLDQYLPYWK